MRYKSLPEIYFDIKGRVQQIFPVINGFPQRSLIEKFFWSPNWKDIINFVLKYQKAGRAYKFVNQNLISQYEFFIGGN